MAKECLCQANEIVVFPCSDGSNCGQIANQVAVDLTEDGVGTIFCLAGIGAHIPGMIESAKSAKRIVVIALPAQRRPWSMPALLLPTILI